MTTKQRGRRSVARAKNGKRRSARRGAGRNATSRASTSSSGIQSHKKRARSVVRKAVHRRRAPRVTLSGVAETIKKQTERGLVVAREKLKVARKVAERTISAVATSAAHVVEGVKEKLVHA
jgi:hypothetical protein